MYSDLQCTSLKLVIILPLPLSFFSFMSPSWALISLQSPSTSPRYLFISYLCISLLYSALPSFPLYLFPPLLAISFSLLHLSIFLSFSQSIHPSLFPSPFLAALSLSIPLSCFSTSNIDYHGTYDITQLIDPQPGAALLL